MITNARRETIRQMMLRYEDARSQADGTGGKMGGNNEHVILWFDPDTWTDEFRELERCLSALRHAAEKGLQAAVTLPDGQKPPCASLWWNLRERFLAARTVRRELRTQKTAKGRRFVNVPRNSEVIAGAPTSAPCIVYLRVWSDRVDPVRVEAALDWIATEYRGTPALPREMVA